MEIGPISAVRPVPMIKVSRGAPDLSRVCEVEYLGQSDDEYTQANGKAARGLEDEEDVVDETAEPGVVAATVVPSNKVSFFA
jgi:hypothetical protein